MPTYELTEDDFNGDEIDILSILQKSGLAPSRSEARRNVEQGGVSVDGNQVKISRQSSRRISFPAKEWLSREVRKTLRRLF